MDVFLIQILNALFYASILFLIAAGLNLIYGVMGIVNMAHGSFFAFGAYIAASVINMATGNLSEPLIFLLLLIGAIAVGILGMIVEPFLLRPLYKRGVEEYPLLITFGLLLILEDSMRFIWGGNPISAGVLVEYLGSIKILGLQYPVYGLFVICVGAFAGLFLWAFVYRTRFGIILRATSQDMKMASGLGLNVERIYMLAFGVGSFMAGLGGAIVVSQQSAALGMGMDALILSFVVVVIGGLGSLKGAFAGALIVSSVRGLGIQFFPEIELAVTYLIAAGVLLVRPTGLYGAKA
jgi:branched-chain amino acid transport system permease protein